MGISHWANPVTAGGVREILLAQRRRAYHSRIAQGLCPKCGARHGGETIKCGKCRQRQRATNPPEKGRKTREERLAAGNCSRCGSRKPVKGGKRCSVCIEQGKTYSKRTITSRLMLELCTKCGKEEPLPNRKYGEKCITKARQRKEKAQC